MPLSADQVRKLVRTRGWTFVDLAARWGISVTWMSRLVNQPHSRPLMYEDAFAGLPQRTAVAVSRESRHVRKRRVRKQWSVAEMFPRDRLFEATDSRVVDEGTILVVHEIQGQGRDNAKICFRLADAPDDEEGEIVLDVAAAQCHFADLCRDLPPRPVRAF